MFFESSDIDFKILCVLHDERKYSLGNSGNRPFHALSFRMEGDAVFESKSASIKAESGDIMLCPKNCPYNINADKENLYVIHFETDAPLPTSLKKFTPLSPEMYKRDLSRIYSAWNSKRIGYEHECKYLLHKLFMNIEREWAERISTADKLTAAVEYIHDHFCDGELSISELATMCSVSDTYFRKLFKERFSLTPLKYINNLKVTHAVELLQSKYYTVTEVAEKCGFENVYYFSLFIKKETGYSPSQICDIDINM